MRQRRRRSPWRCPRRPTYKHDPRPPTLADARIQPGNLFSLSETFGFRWRFYTSDVLKSLLKRRRRRTARFHLLETPDLQSGHAVSADGDFFFFLFSTKHSISTRSRSPQQQVVLPWLHQPTAVWVHVPALSWTTFPALTPLCRGRPDAAP